MIKGLLKISYNLDTNEIVLGINEDIKINKEDLEELKGIADISISVLKKYLKEMNNKC